MSKETAKKLIAELQTNDELRTKIEGITDPAEMVKKAVEAGYDVSVEEMLEAEREFRAELAAKTDEQKKALSVDEIEAVAGGRYWGGDTNSEGKELGCAICNIQAGNQDDTTGWCTNSYICSGNVKEYKKPRHNKHV